MNKKIAFTIVSLNYLSLARILGKSFKKHHPDVEFVILIADKIGDRIDISKEEFRIFSIAELGIKNKEELLFKYNITELNTAVKPLFINHLFDNEKADFILYIDPDIYIYNRLDAVLDGLEKYDAVFTPHILSPMPDNVHTPNEISIMQVGCFNLGFVAFRNTPEVRAFISWWWERLQVYSVSAPEKGLFTDQKWMDYAPSFLSKILVLRDFGYNVAYWNLHERKNFTKKDGIYYVNDVPLRFFHYSGFLLDNQEAISKFQDRFVLSAFGEVLKSLFYEYGEALKGSDFLNTKKIPYGYSVFDNGVKIPEMLRKVYYELPNKKRFGNPFSVTNENGFYGWLTKPSKAGSSLTNLIFEIYKLRPDIQKVFPEPFSQESAMLDWASSSLAHDYGIDSRLLPEISNQSESIIKRIGGYFYGLATMIERKYFVDSHPVFRFVKRIVGPRIFRFIKKRFYKYKYKLVKFRGLSKSGVPIEYFKELSLKFADKSYDGAIVLFRPHGVGDLLMALPAFKKFREKEKGKKIILYVYEESFQLMKVFPFFDEVLSLPRTYSYEEQLAKLPLPRQASFYNLMLELEIGKKGNNLDNELNRINRNDLISKVLEVENDYELIDIPSNHEAQKRVSEIVQQVGLKDEKFVLITFEATNVARSWYPKYYKALIEEIIKMGMKVVIIGNKNTYDAFLPDEDENFINLIGKTKDLIDVVELLKEAAYVVSVDTYLMQVAGHLNKPFLAIFTGGVKPDSRVAHFSRKVVAISKHECFCWDMPCKFEERRGKNELCRIDLKPDVVFAKFKQLMEEYPLQ
jgi:ADP-heptose:LPS heptosyltransferase